MQTGITWHTNFSNKHVLVLYTLLIDGLDDDQTQHYGKISEQLKRNY
jgi:hypothetical protein